jgi:hypothetical protein
MVPIGADQSGCPIPTSRKSKGSRSWKIGMAGFPGSGPWHADEKQGQSSVQFDPPFGPPRSNPPVGPNDPSAPRSRACLGRQATLRWLSAAALSQCSSRPPNSSAATQQSAPPALAVPQVGPGVSDVPAARRNFLKRNWRQRSTLARRRLRLVSRMVVWPLSAGPAIGVGSSQRRIAGRVRRAGLNRGTFQWRGTAHATINATPGLLCVPWDGGDLCGRVGARRRANL